MSRVVASKKVMALHWFDQGFFLFVLTTALLNVFSAAELGSICRQAVFEEVSKGECNLMTYI